MRTHHCSCGTVIARNPGRGAPKTTCERCRAGTKRECDRRRAERRRIARQRKDVASGLNCKRYKNLPWRRGQAGCLVCGQQHGTEAVGVVLPSGGQWVWV